MILAGIVIRQSLSTSLGVLQFVLQHFANSVFMTKYLFSYASHLDARVKLFGPNARESCSVPQLFLVSEWGSPCFNEPLSNRLTLAPLVRQRWM